MKRRVAREKALQALFQIDMSGIEPAVALRNVLEEEEKMDAYLEQIVLGFIENQERIDGHIRENLEKWSFDRLAKVDRNILRLGVYELLFVEDVPNNVVINEAVEIAKIFGDDQSSKFINGVLSKVSQS
ncbi:transcription antitermination factor NusB [Rossellomorea vietnamensis]|uniref:transcription antitermination factor NusB n=1 Tax=Rossellomorea TaxID=2837508 RepID=UPI001CCC6C88|nr:MULTISPECIES: transcription antitermination factor NusB [Rossellomorea]MCA0147662.1 transcription antitermination factor NusB [Rossellomorea vietnamensis]UTE76287.1 transcription antitermination factor NusB [Rossellomorea sp. KS-H15a]